MLVRMKQYISGYRDGVPWPLKGGTVEVPDHEGADLIANGYAEEADGGDAPAPADTSSAPEGDTDTPVATDEAVGTEPVRKARPRRGAGK